MNFLHFGIFHNCWHRGLRLISLVSIPAHVSLRLQWGWLQHNKKPLWIKTITMQICPQAWCLMGELCNKTFKFLWCLKWHLLTDSILSCWRGAEMDFLSFLSHFLFLTSLSCLQFWQFCIGQQRALLPLVLKSGVGMWDSGTVMSLCAGGGTQRWWLWGRCVIPYMLLLPDGMIQRQFLNLTPHTSSLLYAKSALLCKRLCLLCCAAWFSFAGKRNVSLLAFSMCLSCGIMSVWQLVRHTRVDVCC